MGQGEDLQGNKKNYTQLNKNENRIYLNIWDTIKSSSKKKFSSIKSIH